MEFLAGYGSGSESSDGGGSVHDTREFVSMPTTTERSASPEPNEAPTTSQIRLPQPMVTQVIIHGWRA